MFKPAKIESRRGRIPVSEAARQEARAGMGGEQTALAAADAASAPAAGPAGRRPRVAKALATAADPNHSVKLPKSTMQQIKLTLALLPAGAGHPATIKQYLEMAHQLLDAQLRKAGKLPPAA